MRTLTFLVVWMAALCFESMAQAATTSRLHHIRDAGVINCGVAGDMPGFSELSSASATGMDVDICRGLAAALLGSADRARFTRISGIKEFLSRRDVDVVFHGLTWTFEREARWNIRFGPVTYYDGAGLVLPRMAAARHVLELNNAAICIHADYPSLEPLRRFLASGSNLRLIAYASEHESREAFHSGHCTALGGDASTLVTSASGHNPRQFEILQDRITKEPLAPIVRATDDDLLMLLRLVVYATIQAEELGIGSTSAASPIDAAFPPASQLGLPMPDGWASRVILGIGNYAEIFERNFSRPDRIGQNRGLNRLWRDGGLMYAPPSK
ncbi:MAG: transporter substrate-binding domain-containing protein [Pseudomonadota bacterium]|nr:transporter substrate-binding domain-containing protein [Pseudomonadota bacterium]